MKNNELNNLHNSQFEQLLKKSLLENSNDKFNQKIMDMNANYIFNEPASIINTNKIESLINKHLTDTKRSLNIFYYLKYIIPIVLVISGYLLFNKFNNNKQNFVPIITENTDDILINTDSIKSIETKHAVLLNQKSVSSIALPNDTIIAKKDSIIKTKKHTTKPKRKNGLGGGIPNYMKNYEYPDLYDVPAPVFNMEAAPDKYRLKAERAYIKNYHFKIDKRNYFISTYTGEPFSKGMDNYVYINNLPKKTTYSSYSDITNTHKHWEQNNLFLPNSIRFNLTSYNYTNDNKIIINKLNNSQIESLVQPFYIAKYETTVKEYKEFTDWVLKSNGYDSLPYKVVKGAEPMFQPIDTSKVNYYKKTKWVSSKEKAYKYAFFEPTKKILIALNGNSLCVAPCDTIDINKHHFPNMSINPFYHSNEYYSNFPIVGVSYYQVLAFLDWKTHFHQQQLDKELVNYEIEYALPNTIQRRLAMYPQHVFDDNNWLTDLKLTQQETNYIDKTINQYNVYKHDYATTALIQAKIDYRSYTFLKEYTLKNGIEWLDGNVSEWMAETYKENWLPIYNLHKKQMLKTEDGKLANSIEEYYNNKNDKNGQLVIGGNYFDYRNGMVTTRVPYERYPKDVRKMNKAGIYLKKFVDPHKQYSTVGFRYIIKVKDVEEKRKTELLQLIGNYDNNMYQDFPEKYMENFKKFDNDKYILDREVTNSMWRSFLLDLLESGQKETALKCIPKSELWSKYNEDYIYYFKEQKYDELPVVNISHEAAQIFNNWLTKKFNNYALRKYALVEFKLPTEKEWEKVAYGKEFTGSRYTWAGFYARDYKGRKYGNYKISPYEGPNLVFSTDSGFKSDFSSNKYVFNKVSDSLRLPYYEDFVNGKISYKQFLDLDYEYLKLKETLNANTSLVTKNTYFNTYEVCNLMGNVAEMLDVPNKTKGGSWNTYANFMVYYRSEQWNGKPLPMVGFRPVMIIKSSANYENLKGINCKTPPGTVLLSKNLGIDAYETRNTDYREFLFYTKKTYGNNSEEYKKILPDTNCWINSAIYTKPYVELYLRHPAYTEYPIVGISYEQAQEYCKWRSKVVNDYNNIYKAKHPKDKTAPKKITYRLPTPEEWDNLLIIDSLYEKGKYVFPKDKNYSNKKAINDSLDKPYNHLTSPVFSYWPNKLGLYGLNANVSELTAKKGIAKGRNWKYRKPDKYKNNTILYTKPESYIGFRCVVDIDYTQTK